MTKWHAYIVHMAKHTNMVGGPFVVGGPGPGHLAPTLNPAMRAPLLVFDKTLVQPHFVL